MRIAVRGDTLLERLAVRARLAPVPAIESLAGMALSGVLITGARLGVLERLATRPSTAAQLAADLGLEPATCHLLVDVLFSLGYLTCRDGTYTVTRRTRRWLLPSSTNTVHRFIASHRDYWRWWAALPEVAEGRRSFDHHATAPNDPYWQDYIAGQYELARFQAPEVARAVRLPPRARRLLDIGGGHGWYAAELCRRHPGLRATVLDLPGSAAVGRQIIAEAGLTDRVQHREGDVRDAPLGSDYDVVLCLNLIHHLGPEHIVPLFSRVQRALRPGGTVVVLDLFADTDRRRRPDPAASCLALLFHLSSGATLYTGDQVRNWLTAAGFAPARGRRLRRVPTQALYQAARPAE